jgi:hypothetical protein
MPFSEAILHTDDGIPYGRPEIVLLFKARHAAQEKNQDDFEATLPLIDERARARLSDWISLVHPGHRWLRQLG